MAEKSMPPQQDCGQTVDLLRRVWLLRQGLGG